MKQVVEVLLIYKRRISNGSSEIQFFSLEYRSGKLQVGKKEIEKEVTFEGRPLFSRSFREREKKNSLGRNPERRIIPADVHRRRFVRVYQSPWMFNVDDDNGYTNATRS